MLKYPRLNSPTSQDRILIVAPHMDDESIGAAGYALGAASNGATVSVAFLTAGDCNRLCARLTYRTIDPSPAQYLEVGRTRITESRAAMRLLGISERNSFILGYPDRGLRAMLDQPNAVVRSLSTRQECVPYDESFAPGSAYRIENLMRDMQRVLEVTRPTVIVAPVPFDQHPDHNATAEIVDVALDRAHLSPRRLGYLVHSPAFKSLLPRASERELLPPLFLRGFDWMSYPLSNDIQRLKDEAICTYRSQQPYTYVLRNSFVRSNELFVRYGRMRVPERTPTSLAYALLSSSPSLY